MSSVVLQTFPLGTQWPTLDPFLFCAHHLDHYPRSNGSLGPAADLTGRSIGQDFAGVDGWNMYHGSSVPGFPQHPHRGFETVTYLKQGFCDHSDSLGAQARFGPGDAQWLTAGSGIVHAEMFPLLDPVDDNPLHLFQIWLNLPTAGKMVDPYFSMLWRETIPRVSVTDDEGRSTSVTVIAGRLDDRQGPKPPPDSWASAPDSDIAIWHVEMEGGARWLLPSAHPGSNRALYLFGGSGADLGHPSSEGVSPLAGGTGAAVEATVDVSITAGPDGAEFLMLQGRPIGEPVAQYGPFVMNDEAGIRQALLDYQRTGFGGWPWPDDDPVHGAEPARFARHADGRIEQLDLQES